MYTGKVKNLTGEADVCGRENFVFKKKNCEVQERLEKLRVYY